MSDPQVEITVAIVYADISGSTALYERVGNFQARSMIAACLNLLRDAITKYQGTFIHSRGDDVLCTFDSAETAISAVNTMLASTAKGDLSVHIGVDYGSAIRTSDDIFGDPVNVAARLADLATPNEALCSNALHKNLSDATRASLRFFDTRQLRGKSGPEPIYRYANFNPVVDTQVSFAHTDHGRIGTGAAGQPIAYISFLDTTISCQEGGSLTIGRAEDCDLVLPRQWVSRQHAVIEMRKDHAYLRDVSSNGIYVCLVGQQPILLRRETMVLPIICTLSPTKHPNSNEALSITCHVTAQAPADEAPA